MPLKAGSLVTVGNGVALIERLQSGGPGSLNIPKEKISELGNYEAVATLRDIPDLTFTLESFDVSTDVEQMLTQMDVADVLADGIDLAKALPFYAAQNFKPGKKFASPFVATRGVAIPHLTLQSAQYRFGARDNATETFTLQGDSIYYCPGAVYLDEVEGSGSAGQTIVTSHPAYPYTDSNGTRRILAVTAGANRLTLGADYTLTEGSITDDAAIVTIHLVNAVPVTDKIHVAYHSPDAITYLQSVHTPATLKPAAVKGKDIAVYVGGYDPADVAGSGVNLFTGVQSVSIQWQVTLETSYEMGNPNAVSRDFDTPTVTGSIDIQARDAGDLFAKLAKITGVSGAHEAIGPELAALLPLDVVIRDAETGGTTLKRFHVPDARFSVPGYNPQVDQNITMTLDFESDGGNLQILRDLVKPSITEVDPDSGEATDEVVITGLNFVGVTAVKFDTTNATSFTVDNHRQITAVVPAGSVGASTVTVTTPAGTSDPATFTYTA